MTSQFYSQITARGAACKQTYRALLLLLVRRRLMKIQPREMACLNDVYDLYWVTELLGRQLTRIYTGSEKQISSLTSSEIQHDRLSLERLIILPQQGLYVCGSSVVSPLLDSFSDSVKMTCWSPQGKKRDIKIETIHQLIHAYKNVYVCRFAWATSSNFKIHPSASQSQEIELTRRRA